MFIFLYFTLTIMRLYMLDTYRFYRMRKDDEKIIRNQKFGMYLYKNNRNNNIVASDSCPIAGIIYTKNNLKNYKIMG